MGATNNEFYFDYKIERVFGDATIKTPNIYFERDYRTPDMPYTMFAVLDEWLDKQEILTNLRENADAESRCRELNLLEYEEVKVVYDIRGINCAPLSNINSSEYKKAEIVQTVTFEKFYQKGCRVVIENYHSQDHSGIGVIEMLKNNLVVARFYFVVNFTFKKRISYKLILSGDKINIEFQCKDCPVGVPVTLVYNKGRLPCLRNDMNVNQVDTFELKFSFMRKYTYQKKLVNRETDSDNIYSVTINDENYSKYYLLDCLENNTLPKTKYKETYIRASYSCPYCHQPINVDLAKHHNYKKGGISCRGASQNQSLEIKTKGKSKIKKCLYCYGDLKDDDILSFRGNMQRLLPPKFMEHENFKIAFTGSTRAGKTTYISRLFGISGDAHINMSMDMAANSLKEFGIEIKAAPIFEVERESGREYRITDRNWYASQDQYLERAISLYPSKYPNMTPSGDLTQYPFIAEINKEAYISFYDIAGEDAQQSSSIRNIAANGEVIGIFCVINGNSDAEGNKEVYSRLLDAQLDANCPVAVILTKFDIIADQFDNNCFCLRSDYFDKSTHRYGGEQIEWEIDQASEEIKSYLKNAMLLPNLDGYFHNIKYFGVSSFNFLDSIHDANANIEAPGRVKFECSGKRLELPLLWMLKQFAIIK